MTNLQGALGAVVVLVAVARAPMDTHAADNPEHPTVTNDGTRPAAIIGFVRMPYRATPSLARDIPSFTTMSNIRTARAWKEPSVPAPQASATSKQRSVARKVFGAIIGATGGFLAGGYLGSAIEGDCNCDDPGLKGAVIGAPIGAVSGGILGYKFLF